jgi:hypothetical protein
VVLKDIKFKITWLESSEDLLSASSMAKDKKRERNRRGIGREKEEKEEERWTERVREDKLVFL